MPVDVQVATHRPVPDVARIQAWAEAALAADSPEAAAGELCVRVVDDEESQTLNHTYRHKDSPTNVLSFPADVDAAPVRLLGDVVICAPVVERESAAQGKQFEDHFAHMVVHGVLHLLGYDHQCEADAAAMEEREIRILRGFGVRDPYGEG